MSANKRVRGHAGTAENPSASKRACRSTQQAPATARAAPAAENAPLSEIVKKLDAIERAVTFNNGTVLTEIADAVYDIGYSMPCETDVSGIERKLDALVEKMHALAGDHATVPFSLWSLRNSVDGVNKTLLRIAHKMKLFTDSEFDELLASV